jgi:hypothetical protein
MKRKAVAFLAAGAMWASAQALGPTIASADRPTSDITCTPGERATYDGGRHRFQDGAVVLGCAPLAGGGRLQLDASRGRNYSAQTCFWLTYGPPPTQGLFVCPKRLRNAAQPLLILRHRSPLPVLVMGTAPPDAERLVVSHTTADGTQKVVHPAVMAIGARGAEDVGAPGAFKAFVAELGPDVDVCRGISPRAFDSAGSRLPARSAAPRGTPLQRPDGWLAGFAPSYGVGFGPGDPPKLCKPVSRAPPVEAEPWSVRPLAHLRLILDRLADLFGWAARLRE